MNNKRREMMKEIDYMGDPNEWRGKLRRADHAISGAIMMVSSFLKTIRSEKVLSKFEESRLQFSDKAWVAVIDEKLWNDEITLARGMLEEIKSISKVIYAAKAKENPNIPDFNGLTKSALEKMRNALEGLLQAA